MGRDSECSSLTEILPNSVELSCGPVREIGSLSAVAAQCIRLFRSRWNTNAPALKSIKINGMMIAATFREGNDLVVLGGYDMHKNIDSETGGYSRRLARWTCGTTTGCINANTWQGGGNLLCIRSCQAT